jgi:putative hydrolase of the HAD superfamily
MRKYRLLLFDADETLFDYRCAERTALSTAFAEKGLFYREEEHLPLYRKINHVMWERLERGEITPPELRVERFREYFELLGITMDPADFSHVYLTALSRNSMLIDGALETVTVLAPHFQMALLSNGLAEVQKPRFDNSPLDRFFPVRIISGEVGLVKPDPRIFALTLERCGHTDKSTVLMIGDSVTSDMTGGVAFGIDTCWYAPLDKSLPEGIRPTYRIRRLSELPVLLGVR